LAESAGTRQLNPLTLRLPVGAGEGQGGGMDLRPKDSNAAGLTRATEKALEGTDRQTDIQTFCAL